jgi:hypothetical protein
MDSSRIRFCLSPTVPKSPRPLLPEAGIGLDAGAGLHGVAGIFEVPREQ